MRTIVFGVGAVGGVVAGALTQSGHEVIGIARGQRLAAIREKGLLLRSHDGDTRVRFDCVSAPSEIDFRPDDTVLLSVKTMDTPGALAALRAAGVRDQPLFCLQNGVENERMALRVFPNVHAINVMLPAEYMQDDEAICFGKPHLGVFDIGRYPNGADASDAALAGALEQANIASFVEQDVMQNKYGKLLVNLGNIIEAALGCGVRAPEVAAALQAEARDVYAAAGIAWRDMGDGDPRRGILLNIAPIKGQERIGGSSTQSLLRGAGSIETDYLNGEIALIARQNGKEAPLNARIVALAARLAEARQPPGSLTPAELAAEIGF